MARLFVKADKEGQILSVVRVDALPEGQKNPFYDDDDPNINIIEIKDAHGKSMLSKMEVVDIHVGYVLDTKKRMLKKKEP